MPEDRGVESPLLQFTAGDELTLHQLCLRRWLIEQSTSLTKTAPPLVAEIPRLTDLSAPWRLTPGIKLMD